MEVTKVESEVKWRQGKSWLTKSFSHNNTDSLPTPLFTSFYALLLLLLLGLPFMVNLFCFTLWSHACMLTSWETLFPTQHQYLTLTCKLVIANAHNQTKPTINLLQTKQIAFTQRQIAKLVATFSRCNPSCT